MSELAASSGKPARARESTKSAHILLDEAERAWREEVRRDFPLRANTEVIRKARPDGRDWTFYTDLHKIFAIISNDEKLRKRFETEITKYWDGNPEDLLRETLHYLLYHELYHPLEAPFSVTGENNDNQKIHQAIRRGLVKAQPKLSPLEQVVKVQLSQNGVKDLILDNRLYLDNGQRGYFKNDIIPTWDVLEIADAEPRTNFYTATRLLYGVLYGPGKARDLFGKQAGKKGNSVAERSLSALLQKEVRLPKKEAELVRKAKKLIGRDTGEKDNVRLAKYIREMRAVFSGADRYNGIERLMSILGPYVEREMPQVRFDIGGESAGVSPQSILQDLLGDMDPEEQSQFLQSLAQEKPESLAQVANQIQPGDSTTNGNVVRNEMNNLDLLATHEYYKRNHPRVKLLGGKQIGESVIIGKKEYWALQRSTILTEDQLGKLNLARIDRLQRITKLPWLISHGNGTFTLNEYESKEREIKDVRYVDATLDVPDVVELYVDSSGSMGTQNFRVNDGSRWDMLISSSYGLVGAVQKAGQIVQKESKVRVHNFADTQLSSELIPVSQFWAGNIPFLQGLFKPNNGYGQEDLDLSFPQTTQKTAYVVVTDGELVIQGRTEREAGKMKRLAKMLNTKVVLFEIGGTYSLGNAVNNDPNISYSQVYDKQRLFEAGLEVLLAK